MQVRNMLAKNALQLEHGGQGWLASPRLAVTCSVHVEVRELSSQAGFRIPSPYLCLGIKCHEEKATVGANGAASDVLGRSCASLCPDRC